MTRITHTSLAALLLLLGTGCTSGDSIPRITGAPSLPSDISSLHYDSEHSLTTLATAANGMVIASDASVLLLNDGELTNFTVRADADEATETGTVAGLTARPDTVLLSSDEGLYQTYENELLRSPLNDELGLSPFETLHSSGQGDSEQIWAANNSLVYRIAANSLTQWTFDQLEGDILAIAFTGTVAIIITPNALYELEPSSSEITPIEAKLGTLHGLSVGDDGRAYIASDEGLVARSTDGSYVVYTLSDDAQATPVTAVHVDSAVGVIAATSDGLVTLDTSSDTAVGLASFEHTQTVNAVSTDDNGYAWLTYDQSLQGWLVGSPTSFELEVLPILETNCTSCHDEGSSAPALDLRDLSVVQSRASDIMSRLDAQQMPPDQPLENHDYETFRRWYRSGQNP